MTDFNKMPENAKEIEPGKEYEEMTDFFIYKTKQENRAAFYDNEDIKAGLADVKIWWVRKEAGLGFALKRDWKAEKMRWYRLGKDEDWLKFKRGFAAQFRGDNS